MRINKEQKPIVVKIDTWKDGDTFSFLLPYDPPINKFAVRILGIDTPESSPRHSKCRLEMNLGKLVTKYVRLLFINNTYAILTNYKWDKFGGRLDAKVQIGSIDVAKHLIEKGYAVPYHGRKKTHKWCNHSDRFIIDINRDISGLMSELQQNK